MKKHFTKNESGFSLIELLIAMTLTLVVLGISTTLLARGFNVRTRANDNVDALADAERAMNIMSREISQAGFNLSDNGIVAEDSVIDANGNSTIRIRANLNKFGDPAQFSVQARGGIGVQDQDAGEDVKYFVYPAAQTTLLARYDPYFNATPTVLANRLDQLRIHYFSERVTYSLPNCATPDVRCCDIENPSMAEVAPAAARYVVVAVCVRQEAVGAPGAEGYQPAHN